MFKSNIIVVCVTWFHWKIVFKVSLYFVCAYVNNSFVICVCVCGDVYIIATQL